MEQRPKILKVNLDSEIRRVALTAADFLSLQTQVAELFSLQPGTFSLKYKDDEGDLITLGSPEEYVEALSCCATNVLRLTVIKKEESAGHGGRHGGRCGGRRWGGRCGWKRRLQQQLEGGQNPLGQLFPMIQHFAGNLIQGGNFDQILENLLKSDFCKLEQNYTCDGCNTTICGARYHCETCPDFDFCSSCYAQKLSTHDGSHQFKEVTALSALKDALASNNISIDAFFAPGTATDPAPKIVFHRAFCDRCDATIEGIRWKCFECQDFDFCNACYLAAAGKETIRTHRKEHGFAKIEEPEQISSFPSLLAEYQNKRDGTKKNDLLAKIEQQKKEEEERHADLERKKIKLEEQMEEERKKHKEREAQLEKERLELLEKQKSLTQDKPKEEKQLNPLDQKLDALEAMGFVDRERNIKLLLKHKGEIFPVIQDLLN